jgi:hypothetical protein
MPDSLMDPRSYIRGEKGLQTLEWIALALALLAALAIGLKQTEAGPGEAVTAAVSAMFRCRTSPLDCPLTAVGIEGAGACLTQPTGCLVRWGDRLLRGVCEGADPRDLWGLLPWLALAGIAVGGVVFSLLPPSVGRRWRWPRLAFPPQRSPRGRPAAPPPRGPFRSRSVRRRRLLRAQRPGLRPLPVPPLRGSPLPRRRLNPPHRRLPNLRPEAPRPERSPPPPSRFGISPGRTCSSFSRTKETPTTVPPTPSLPPSICFSKTEA